MRLIFDRAKHVQSAPEMRAEIDSGLMLLAERLMEMQDRHFATCHDHDDLKAILKTLTPTEQRIRILGIAIVRALELMKEHDPAGFHAVAENTVKVFIEHIEEEHPEPDELTPEEAAMLLINAPTGVRH